MKIHLEWPASPVSQLVHSYKVSQSDNGLAGPYVVIATVASPVYEIDDPAPGSYAWKVRAVNIAGESADSNPVSGPSLPSAPNPPTVTVIP